jgi:hypothetical protein
MFYGPSYEENYRRAAALADKILRGARPSELPVEDPTKFELVINLKTAHLWQVSRYLRARRASSADPTRGLLEPVGRKP